jgi:hypothetical protein
MRLRTPTLQQRLPLRLSLQADIPRLNSTQPRGCTSGLSACWHTPPHPSSHPPSSAASAQPVWTVCWHACDAENTRAQVQQHPPLLQPASATCLLPQTGSGPSQQSRTLHTNLKAMRAMEVQPAACAACWTWQQSQFPGLLWSG